MAAFAFQPGDRGVVDLALGTVRPAEQAPDVMIEVADHAIVARPVAAHRGLLARPVLEQFVAAALDESSPGYIPVAERIATFEEDEGAYDQADAEGFIKLNALRLKMQAHRRKEKSCFTAETRRRRVFIVTAPSAR